MPTFCADADYFFLARSLDGTHVAGMIKAGQDTRTGHDTLEVFRSVADLQARMRDLGFPAYTDRSRPPLPSAPSSPQSPA
jgi:hypothetical protein